MSLSALEDRSNAGARIVGLVHHAVEIHRGAEASIRGEVRHFGDALEICLDLSHRCVGSFEGRTRVEIEHGLFTIAGTVIALFEPVQEQRKARRR